MTTILTGVPARCSALSLKRVKRSSSPAPSPPATECFDIFSLPGDSEVTSHLDRLSSNETKIEATSERMAVSLWTRWWLVGIGRLLDGWFGPQPARGGRRPPS
jgi:hypothetical protein